MANIILTSPTQSVSGACIQSTSSPSFANCPESYQFKDNFEDTPLGSFSGESCSEIAKKICAEKYEIGVTLKIKGECIAPKDQTSDQETR